MEEKEYNYITVDMLDKLVGGKVHKKSLEIVDFSNQDIFRLVSLENIDIIGQRDKSKRDAVKEFHLQHNLLTTLVEIAGPGDNPMFRNVNLIYASNNGISAICATPRNSIANAWPVKMEALRELDLAKNKLVSIPDLRNMPNLQKLVLRSNEITPPWKQLRRGRNLAHVDLSDNRLDWTPVEFNKDLSVLKRMPDLKELHLRGNPFTSEVPEYHLYCVRVLRSVQSEKNLIERVDEKPVDERLLERTQHITELPSLRIVTMSQLGGEELTVPDAESQSTPSFPNITKFNHLLEDGIALPQLRTRRVFDLLSAIRVVTANPDKHDFLFEGSIPYDALKSGALPLYQRLASDEFLQNVCVMMERHGELAQPLIRALGYLSAVTFGGLGRRCLAQLRDLSSASENHRCMVAEAVQTCVLPQLERLFLDGVGTDPSLAPAPTAMDGAVVAADAALDEDTSPAAVRTCLLRGLALLAQDTPEMLAPIVPMLKHWLCCEDPPPDQEVLALAAASAQFPDSAVLLGDPLTPYQPVFHNAPDVAPPTEQAQIMADNAHLFTADLISGTASAGGGATSTGSRLSAGGGEEKGSGGGGADGEEASVALSLLRLIRQGSRAGCEQGSPQYFLVLKTAEAMSRYDVIAKRRDDEDGQRTAAAASASVGGGRSTGGGIMSAGGVLSAGGGLTDPVSSRRVSGVGFTSAVGAGGSTMMSALHGGSVARVGKANMSAGVLARTADVLVGRGLHKDVLAAVRDMSRVEETWTEERNAQVASCLQCLRGLGSCRKGMMALLHPSRNYMSLLQELYVAGAPKRTSGVGAAVLAVVIDALCDLLHAPTVVLEGLKMERGTLEHRVCDILNGVTPLLEYMGGRRYTDLAERMGAMFRGAVVPIKDLRHPAMFAMLKACIRMVKYWCSRARMGVANARLAVTVAAELDRADRELCLFACLQCSDEDVRLAVVRCLRHVPLSEFDEREIGLLVEMLASTRNIVTGSTELALKLSISILTDLCLSDGRSGHVFRVNSSGKAIAAVMGILVRNNDRDTRFNEAEDAEKRVLSTACLRFLQACSAWEFLRPLFRSPSSMRALSSCLRLEDRNTAHFSLHHNTAAARASSLTHDPHLDSAEGATKQWHRHHHHPLYLEQTAVGSQAEYLLALLSGPRPLRASGVVAHRVITRLANILIGTSEPSTAELLRVASNSYADDNEDATQDAANGAAPIASAAPVAFQSMGKAARTPRPSTPMSRLRRPSDLNFNGGGRRASWAAAASGVSNIGAGGGGRSAGGGRSGNNTGGGGSSGAPRLAAAHRPSQAQTHTLGTAADSFYFFRGGATSAGGGGGGGIGSAARGSIANAPGSARQPRASMFAAMNTGGRLSTAPSSARGGRGSGSAGGGGSASGGRRMSSAGGGFSAGGGRGSAGGGRSGGAASGMVTADGGGGDGDGGDDGASDEEEAAEEGSAPNPRVVEAKEALEKIVDVSAHFNGRFELTVARVLTRWLVEPNATAPPLLGLQYQPPQYVSRLWRIDSLLKLLPPAWAPGSYTRCFAPLAESPQQRRQRLRQHDVMVSHRGLQRLLQYLKDNVPGHSPASFPHGSTLHAEWVHVIRALNKKHARALWEAQPQQVAARAAAAQRLTGDDTRSFREEVLRGLMVHGDPDVPVRHRQARVSSGGGGGGGAGLLPSSPLLLASLVEARLTAGGSSDGSGGDGDAAIRMALAAQQQAEREEREGEAAAAATAAASEHRLSLAAIGSGGGGGGAKPSYGQSHREGPLDPNVAMTARIATDREDPSSGTVAASLHAVYATLRYGSAQSTQKALKILRDPATLRSFILCCRGNPLAPRWRQYNIGSKLLSILIPVAAVAPSDAVVDCALLPLLSIAAAVLSEMCDWLYARFSHARGVTLDVTDWEIIARAVQLAAGLCSALPLIELPLEPHSAAIAGRSRAWLLTRLLPLRTLRQLLRFSQQVMSNADARAAPPPAVDQYFQMTPYCCQVAAPGYTPKPLRDLLSAWHKHRSKQRPALIRTHITDLLAHVQCIAPDTAFSLLSAFTPPPRPPTSDPLAPTPPPSPGAASGGASSPQHRGGDGTPSGGGTSSPGRGRNRGGGSRGRGPHPALPLEPRQSFLADLSRAVRRLQQQQYLQHSLHAAGITETHSLLPPPPAPTTVAASGDATAAAAAASSAVPPPAAIASAVAAADTGAGTEDRDHLPERIVLCVNAELLVAASCRPVLLVLGSRRFYIFRQPRDNRRPLVSELGPYRYSHISAVVRALSQHRLHVAVNPQRAIPPEPLHPLAERRALGMAAVDSDSEEEAAVAEAAAAAAARQWKLTQRYSVERDSILSLRLPRLDDARRAYRLLLSLAHHTVTHGKRLGQLEPQLPPLRLLPDTFTAAALNSLFNKAKGESVHQPLITAVHMYCPSTGACLGRRTLVMAHATLYVCREDASVWSLPRDWAAETDMFKQRRRHEAAARPPLVTMEQRRRHDLVERGALDTFRARLLEEQRQERDRQQRLFLPPDEHTPAPLSHRLDEIQEFAVGPSALPTLLLGFVRRPEEDSSGAPGAPPPPLLLRGGSRSIPQRSQTLYRFLFPCDASRERWRAALRSRLTRFHRFDPRATGATVATPPPPAGLFGALF